MTNNKRQTPGLSPEPAQAYAVQSAYRTEQAPPGGVA